MFLVKPSHEILYSTPEPLKLIEAAGRTCYKSEDKITGDSAEKFVKMVIKRGHHSVIEHVNMSVRFICDRGVTHEIVRHRLAAYSQESTRYCDYKEGVTFIIPPWCKDLGVSEYTYKNLNPTYILCKPSQIWLEAMLNAERDYIELLGLGWSPQQARSILPNALKTEIVMTANVREWMHVLKLRCSKAAHPQIRELMIPLLEEMKTLVPVIFDDIKGEKNANKTWR